jgi:hypothetical protein
MILKAMQGSTRSTLELSVLIRMDSLLFAAQFFENLGFLR